MNPFRFGVTASRATSRTDWIDTVQAVEGAGYTSLLVSDHLWNQLGPIAAIATAAEHSSLRVGTAVLAADFRHPLVLAKEAATIDLLSEGRLELGIGAGWLTEDYQQLGVEMDAPSVRIERLAEAVAILKQAFGSGEVAFDGRHYTVGPIQSTPSPVQKPHPPFMIGGGGRRILELAAQQAQIVGIAPNLNKGKADPSALGRERTLQAMSERVDIVRHAAQHRFAEIELSVVVIDGGVTADRDRQAEDLARRMNITAAEVLVSPQILLGDVDEIVERLIELRERLGISYVIIGERAWRSLAPVVDRLSGQ